MTPAHQPAVENEEAMVDTTDVLNVTVTGRRNKDARAYKVLMNAAGDTVQYALEPHALRSMAAGLARELDLRSRPDLLLGLAPGGIPITVALAQQLDLPAVIAYKCRLDLPDEVTWSEPHCVNDAFYLYGISPGQTFLLVDDEVDSGRTVSNAVETLRGQGADVLAVAAAVEVLHGGHSSGRSRLDRLGLRLSCLRQLEVGDR